MTAALALAGLMLLPAWGEDEDDGWGSAPEPWMIEIIVPEGRPVPGAPEGLAAAGDATAEDAAWLPPHVRAVIHAQELARRQEERAEAFRFHHSLARQGLYYDVDGSAKPLPECIKAELARKTAAGSDNGPGVRPIYDPDYNEVVGFIWSNASAPIYALDCRVVGVHEPRGAEASLVQPLDFIDIARLIHSVARLAIKKTASAVQKAAFRKQAEQWALFVFSIRRLPEVTQTTLRLSAWALRGRSGLVYDSGRWVFVGYGRPFPLPKGWEPALAKNKLGLVFKAPGATNEEIRLMINTLDAKFPRPYGYFRIRSKGGGYLTRSGAPSKDNALTHFSLADREAIAAWPGGGLPAAP